MKHYGDITKLNGHELPIVDVVTGGSPCQDLSVAGKRAGLAGERSGLFMEQIRIIKELRNECIRQLSMRGAVEPIRPRYMVWENVVGAFSSNNGEDFRAVLEETAKIKDENAYVPRPNGKWANAGVILGNGFSLAWRVHDAQYWGVPQRRRRICLLADFDGNTAPKILFELRRETVDTETEQTVMDIRGESRSEVPIECESLRRNTETCGEQGKGTATITQGNTNESISFQERAGCPGGGKGILIQNEKTASLSTLTNQFVCKEAYGVTSKENGDTFINQNTHTSLASGGGQAGQGYPCVLENSSCNESDNSCYSCDEKMGNTYIWENQANTLAARDYKQPQAVCVENNKEMCEKKSSYQDVVGTLSPGAHAGSYNGQDAYNDMLVISESRQIYGQGSFGNYKQGFSSLKANGGDIGGAAKP